MDSQVLGNVILYVASSLDGHIARDSGEIDWLPQGDMSRYDSFYKAIDIVIMGRITHDQILTFGEYPYKDKKSYVFTRDRSIPKDEHVEFVSDIDEFVKNTLSKIDGNVWLVGGGQIISEFLNRNIIDEIMLSIVPIILGKGRPLLEKIQKETRLSLIKVSKLDKLIELHYRVLK